jgi:hypothetical protein
MEYDLYATFDGRTKTLHQELKDAARTARKRSQDNPGLHVLLCTWYRKWSDPHRCVVSGSRTLAFYLDGRREK